LGLLDFFSWFSKKKPLNLSEYIGKLATEACFKDLAIQACVNLIANTVSRSEFKTFEKGVETKKDNYYLFNVEPNPNKSASKFWRQVIHHLVFDNECLVIQQGNYFYVADSFHVDKYAFKDYIYRDVVIDDFQLSRTFFESEVFHFELHNDKVRTVIEGLYQSYAKLIAAAQKHYRKKNSRRGKLIVPTNYPQTEKAQQELENLLNVRFKRFFEAEGDAIIPVTNGLEYDELENKENSNKGSMEGRDVRAFIDDVFDFVAIAFQVPPQLLKGNVADTDKAVSNFLTFCINPLAELLMDEINRKMYGKQMFLERTYMKLDTSHIRAVDIKDVAGSLDILLRIGAYSVDDCLKYLGMEPLETEWSKARWMTKNYEPITTRHEGGEN